MTFQPEPILQQRLLEPPWTWPRGQSLPGTSPVPPDDWLRVDEAYGAQMALRDRLLSEAPALVLAEPSDTRAAGQETLRAALDLIADWSGFAVGADTVRRGDGVVVQLDWDRPLLMLGRLVQEDICVLEHRGDEHVMTAAVLCFPASWTLAEKIGRPLTGIHAPVEEYLGNIAVRVQRMFDGLRPGAVIRRGNCLIYDDFALFHPKTEAAPRHDAPSDAAFVRAERQCLLKLPDSQAMVFSIHTSVVARARLCAEDAELLEAHLAALP